MSADSLYSILRRKGKENYERILNFARETKAEMYKRVPYVSCPICNESQVYVWCGEPIEVICLCGATLTEKDFIDEMLKLNNEGGK